MKKKMKNIEKLNETTEYKKTSEDILLELIERKKDQIMVLLWIIGLLKSVFIDG